MILSLPIFPGYEYLNIVIIPYPRYRKALEVLGWKLWSHIFIFSATLTSALLFLALGLSCFCVGMRYLITTPLYYDALQNKGLLGQKNSSALAAVNLEPERPSPRQALWQLRSLLLMDLPLIIISFLLLLITGNSHEHLLPARHCGLRVDRWAEWVITTTLWGWGGNSEGT